MWSSEVLNLGEGPLTHHLRNSLIWCDINNRRMYERFFDSEDTKMFEPPVMPSALGIIDRKRHMYSRLSRIQVKNPKIQLGGN